MVKPSLGMTGYFWNGVEIMTLHSDHDAHVLPAGLYDHLVSDEMARLLGSLPDPRLCSVAEVDSNDAHSAIAQYLEHLISSAFALLRGSDSMTRQRRLVARLLQLLCDELDVDWADRLNLADPVRRLLAIHRDLASQSSERPDTPLSRTSLLTGTRVDPSLGSQLRKEFVTADRVDILCSFIKWSGLRAVLGELRVLTARPNDGAPGLRVITTSYMGATDPRAIEALRELPNTEIRVSYNTKRTRLHAKAYIIHRASGFGSAYVGSANLSKAAISEGLEWTTKISQYELPYSWAKVISTFETY